MREYDNDVESDALRPKGSRPDSESDARLMAAAAAGRSEVLNGPGVLALQRAVGNAGIGALLDEEPSPVHAVVNSGGGTPLAPDVRAEMEARLGHDFSDVRVHTDGAAHESARSVNAHAYTVGPNVVFQRDMYDPTSTAGKTMLAHELTHVTQQRAGEVDGTPAAGGIRVSDPADRFERAAEDNAERAMAAPLPLAGTPASATASTLQRQQTPEEEMEDEPLQGAFVQRQEALEEDEDQMA
jgi:hypothetical protein